MELKQYLQILRRWAWVLVLGSLLGGLVGYLVSQLQEPVYWASTRAMVMRAPQGTSSSLDYLSDQQLVQTYMQLLSTQPVLDSTSMLLGYAVDKSQITVKQILDTQIIELTVEDHDPQRAADIANVLLEVLSQRNEAMQIGRYAATEESIQAQIAQVENQINGLQLEVDQISTQDFQDQLREVESQIKLLQDEVSALQQEIATLQTAWSQGQKTQIAEKQTRIAEIQPLLSLYQEIYSNLVVLGKPVEAGANTNSRLAQLQTTLDLYQNLYINLLSNLETVRLARLQNTPNIVQIEQATIPEEPIRPKPLMNITLATIVGLGLAGALVLLVEYMDDTLKTPGDVERALGVPVLGLVAELQYNNKGAEEIYVVSQPRSAVSEAFRTLRTNIESAAERRPVQTILVTSPGPGEGKTTVAVNLAAVFVLSGKRVALVDADMRCPGVHRFLRMPQRHGLSNLFRTQASVQSVSHSSLELPNLMVVTSGALPPNPAELLGSERMNQILTELRDLVDLVVIDTPPSLVADAQILAGKVDAVLFVVQPGVTQAEIAKACFELFQRAGARVIGTILNRIPHNHSEYYGGYKYYSPHSDSKGYYLENVSVSGKGPPPAQPTMPSTQCNVGNITESEKGLLTASRSMKRVLYYTGNTIEREKIAPKDANRSGMNPSPPTQF